MSKKIGLIIMVVLALSLGACTRAASVAPQATPEGFAQPVATDGMNVIEQVSTQTAIAQAGAPQAAESTLAAPADAAAAAEPTFTPVGQAPEATITPMPSPTPNVVAPQPTVATTKPSTYTLQENEFPFCIARRFNVDPAELLSLNGLRNAQTFYAGLTLKIPATGNPFPGARALKAHPVQYTVQAGDTIYSIACEIFGDVDPLNIAAVNGLVAPYKLTVGSQINIP